MVSTLLCDLNAILISTLNDVVCFQLRPVSAAYTTGINHQEEAAVTRYADAGFRQGHCKNSAQIATDNSVDNGYTIHVKTEVEKTETLSCGGPIHWTVNDCGVLVNGDKSEVAIKVEKPDGTTETEMANGSRIIPGREATDAVLFAYDEDNFY